MRIKAQHSLAFVATIVVSLAQAAFTPHSRAEDANPASPEASSTASDSAGNDDNAKAAALALNALKL